MDLIKVENVYRSYTGEPASPEHRQLINKLSAFLDSFKSHQRTEKTGIGPKSQYFIYWCRYADKHYGEQFRLSVKQIKWLNDLDAKVSLQQGAKSGPN